MTENRESMTDHLGPLPLGHRVEHRMALVGAALLNLYLTEVMENPAECRDR